MHKLLTPKVARLGRPDVPPETDAVDPSFSEGTPDSLKADLINLLGETQVLSRVIDLVRFASDASPYRYIPQVVVRSKNIEDVQKNFGYCTTHKRHATFRGGGTSLCGQAQSDDILIDVRHDWNQWQVLDEGQRFKCVLPAWGPVTIASIRPAGASSTWLILRLRMFGSWKAMGIPSNATTSKELPSTSISA